MQIPYITEDGILATSLYGVIALEAPGTWAHGQALRSLAASAEGLPARGVRVLDALAVAAERAVSVDAARALVGQEALAGPLARFATRMHHSDGEVAQRRALATFLRTMARHTDSDTAATLDRLAAAYYADDIEGVPA